MSTKHTPGPWRVVEPEGDVIDANSNNVASIWKENEWDTTEFIVTEEMPWKANARLIAAAPELLDALRELYETALVMECIPLYKGLKKAQKLIDKLTEQ